MANKFVFNISLSVLNHLGRNLYRSFSTVLGEAISNAWDADATNVYINIDKSNNTFSILDDGIGMTEDDFTNKFLKVGYSKRKNGQNSSALNRPFIGRKGIGKLALMSCAQEITIITKTKNSDAIGGIINNIELDSAINDENDRYELSILSEDQKNQINFSNNQGTYIEFKNMNSEIKNTSEYLRKIVALYFRFSIIDNTFKIYINDELVTEKDLEDLISKTEFAWDINKTSNDTYFDAIKEIVNKNEKCKISDLSLTLKNGDKISGFIVSVKKPSNLKIRDTDEVVTVDLFANGRLREKDILKHMRTRRITESYLYGQINYNALDDDEDRFTTSREGIKSEDPKFIEFLDQFKDIIMKILDEWDEFRRNNKEDGDPDNDKITKKERRAIELYNETSKDYEDKDSPIKNEIQDWLDDLGKEARFNFPSYAECFIAENLIRNYIKYKQKSLSEEAERDINNYQNNENKNKQNGGLNIDIRKNNDGIYYLDMDKLANLVDKGNEAYRLSVKAKQYKPTRDAVMHTSILSDDAKQSLSNVFNEIKARIKNLLNNK